MITIEGYLFLTNHPPVKWNQISEDKNNYKGLKITSDTTLNKIHVFSESSLNWNEFHPEIKGWRFPKFLPSDLLKYFREKQICRINIRDINFNLHLSQSIYFEFNNFKPIDLGLFDKAYKKINGS